MSNNTMYITVKLLCTDEGNILVSMFGVTKKVKRRKYILSLEIYINTIEICKCTYFFTKLLK